MKSNKKMAETTKPKIVFIRRQWNDYRIASVKFDKIRDLHWSDISGGVQAPMPQFFVCGYVWCNEVEGDIAHSCEHGEGPHSIKVCVIKKDNTPKIFNELFEIVGPKPKYEKWE